MMPIHRRLETVGRLLYGDRWQRSLAADLDIPAPTFTRYARGEREMPSELETRFAEFCERRANALVEAANQISDVGRMTLVAQGSAVAAEVPHFVAMRSDDPRIIGSTAGDTKMTWLRLDAEAEPENEPEMKP